MLENILSRSHASLISFEIYCCYSLLLQIYEYSPLEISTLHGYAIDHIIVYS